MSALEAVANTLAAVPGIGRVHAYERFATTIATLRQFYYSEPHAQVRGWFVRRTRVYATNVVKPRWTEVESFQLRGFMAWDDNRQSDLEMNALIDSILLAFRNAPTLGGAVTKQGALSAGADQGVRLDDYGPVMLAGVLCHGARLSLTTYTEK